MRATDPDPSGNWARVEPTPTRYVLAPTEMFEGDPMDTAHLYDSHALTVDWRGGDRWAVSLGSGWSRQRVWCEASAEWEWEPSPSNREDDFLARTRYTRNEALTIAKRLAATWPDYLPYKVPNGSSGAS